MRKIKIMVKIIIGLFTIGVFSFVSYQFSLRPVSNDERFYNFVVEPGQSVDQISRNLRKQKLIRNHPVFKVYVGLAGLSSKLQAGEYLISPSESAKQIAWKLTSGFNDVWVTIPEGLRVEEIADYLAQKLVIDRQEFINNAKEGYMFPDTYRLPKDIKGKEVANIMLKNFNEKVIKNLGNDLEKSSLDLNQVIILASLVEREVKFENDRPIVAGILLNRLKLGMPLEVDATVQYALGFDGAQNTYWKRNLTSNDLKIDSPYNTRRYKGLPPGPICSPGVASIKAVLQPVKTDYLYYLSSSDGKIYYAKSLEEHIVNVNKYL